MKRSVILSFGLLAILILALGAAQAQANGEAEKGWRRIGVPGPRGDYQVWGWIRSDGQIGYYPHEQAMPTPAAAKIQNYGVDLHGVTARQRGTFESNDPGFRPGEFTTHATERGPNRSIGPSADDQLDPSVLAAIGILAPVALCAVLLVILTRRRT